MITKTKSTLSPRLAEMRERVIHSPQEISLVRARAVTQAVRNNPNLPRGIQLALGLKETFHQMPITIREGEKIVGEFTEKFRGALLYPEVKSDYLLKELDNFSEREQDSFQVSDAENAEIRTEILPYWIETSAYDEMMSRQSEQALFYGRNLLNVFELDFGGSNHLANINYGRVLEKGWLGILEQAQSGETALKKKDPKADQKRSFYRSIILTCEAVVDYAARYARLAEEMSRQAGSTERARDLQELAGVLAQVPARPARTFREAVQSFWFTYVTLMQLDCGAEIPLGRVDQFLYPYYRRDLDEGRLTREEALELMEELFINLGRGPYLNAYVATKILDGTNERMTMTLGGIDKAGRDATNDLSLLILEAVDTLRLTRPDVAVRLNMHTPEPFYQYVTELMTNGANLVAVFNDKVITEGLVRQNFPVEAARDYVITGCVEPVPGGTYGPACSSFVNGPKVLELVLNGGSPILSLSGDDEDHPTPSFASYQELWDAFKLQLKTVVETTLTALEVVGETQDRLLPNPVLSALIDGALENGRDIKAGGAQHNLTGVDLLGLGTLVDSLAALRYVVYEKKTHTLDEVVEWLKADFDGYEPERRMLLNESPKYGNDDPDTDQIARDVVDWMDELLRPHHTYRKGSYVLGLHSETHHIYQGVMVAASPDGRHAGESLSPGCSPTSGMDREGPTASLRSLTTVDYTRVPGGASAALRFNPALFRTPDQASSFQGLLRGYFNLGGQHLHINVVDTETLRDAQRHPEKYQDLLVRVTGYSARFVDLTAATQEEIIRRSEMVAC